MARARKKKPTKHSPLLRSAIEVLNHGLWHYFRSDTGSDMKFALMHVDQAIELLLKERVRSGGRSIYKNPKETISMYGAYEILEKDFKITIPEKPDLEVLHDERNRIQHQYANPSPEDAGFHIGKAIGFISRFLADELGIDIKDHVPSDVLLANSSSEKLRRSSEKLRRSIVVAGRHDNCRAAGADRFGRLGIELDGAACTRVNGT